MALWRQLGDERGLAQSLRAFSHAMLGRADPAVARSMAQESVAIGQQSGDDWALALALRNLGIGAIKRGDYEQAAVRFREGLIAHQEPGDMLYMVNLDLLAAISMQGEHGRRDCSAWRKPYARRLALP